MNNKLKKLIKQMPLIGFVAKKIKQIIYTRKYHQYVIEQIPLPAVLQQQTQVVFKYHPLISIVMPVFNTKLDYLRAALNSVLDQSYKNWELCVVDGASIDDGIRSMLEEYGKRDSRIKVRFLEQNLHICGNTNVALEMVKGDFIGFLDHDDVLAPNCLYEYVLELRSNSEAELLYCDESFYKNEKHILIHFKPDFALDSLRATNYITHFVVCKMSLLKRLEKPYLREPYQGAQDYDFILRCVEHAKKIVHIPKVLYYWRMHNLSTLGNPESKSYAYENGRLAVVEHLMRCNISASVFQQGNLLGIYKIQYKLLASPLVSIVIPNKDHFLDLEKCIASIVDKSSYTNYEIIIVENNSVSTEVKLLYEKLSLNSNIKIIEYPERGFNYSRINNYAAGFASGDYLIFLNNDTEVINSEWINELLMYAQFPEIGAVGAKLFYFDDTIQHAGCVIARNSIAGNLFDSHPRGNVAEFARTHRVQNLSAVTAACMMVSKRNFTDIGGFDEQLAVAYNDVDLCLKLLSIGKRNIFNPDVELYHFESKSRGYENNAAKKERYLMELNYFRNKWGEYYVDKYYPQVYDNYNYTWKS